MVVFGLGCQPNPQGVLFCLGSLRTRSHRGTSLTPPLALLRSSSPPKSSANTVAARPSPTLNKQPIVTLRPMLSLHGLNATMTNHHEPVEPRDLEIQHLHLRSKQKFKPLLRATLPLCRHHHRNIVGRNCNYSWTKLQKCHRLLIGFGSAITEAYKAK